MKIHQLLLYVLAFGGSFGLADEPTFNGLDVEEDDLEEEAPPAAVETV